MKLNRESFHHEFCKSIYFGVKGQRSRSRIAKQCRTGPLHFCECWLVLFVRQYENAWLEQAATSRYWSIASECLQIHAESSALEQYWRLQLTSYTEHQPTLCPQKIIHLTYDHKFSKCRPTYNILSLSDSWGKFVHQRHKNSPTQLKYVSILPCKTSKLQIYNAADFNGILQDMRPT